jgi:hypothetical protein
LSPESAQAISDFLKKGGKVSKLPSPIFVTDREVVEFLKSRGIAARISPKVSGSSYVYKDKPVPLKKLVEVANSLRRTEHLAPFAARADFVSPSGRCFPPRSPGWTNNWRRRYRACQRSGLSEELNVMDRECGNAQQCRERAMEVRAEAAPTVAVKYDLLAALLEPRFLRRTKQTDVTIVRRPDTRLVAHLHTYDRPASLWRVWAAPVDLRGAGQSDKVRNRTVITARSSQSPDIFEESPIMDRSGAAVVRDGEMIGWWVAWWNALWAGAEWTRVMKRGLSWAEWARLNLLERIALCDVYAREAAQLAQAASPEMRPKYEAIAAEWKKLAAEIESSRHQRQA